MQSRLTRLVPALAVLLAVQVVIAAAPWPSLDEQFREDRVVPGSALERLIRENQDFSRLRPDEAKDLLRLPAWLRVYWRKNHPEAVYSAADPTGGYPLVLKEVHEWMVSHQDLRPGRLDPSFPPPATRTASLSLEQRISGAQTTPRSESDIRINPWDPNHIISASNSITSGGRQAIFYSFDAGASWGQTSLALVSGDTSHSDPTVDWTSDGTAWSATIGIAGGTLRMRAYRSTDNGANWTFDNSFSGTQTNTDKEMIWIDHSAGSPFQNNIYAIWHNGNPAFMNRRTGPGGAWQTPIQVSGAESTGTAIGGDVKTNGSGDVFGFWPTTTNAKTFVVKSTNGGVSYGTPVQIATTFDTYDIGVPSFNNRRALIYVSGGAFRNASKDMVYATWTDLTGSSGCTAPANEPGANTASTCKTRIWFSRSTDGGATWSPKAMVNNQASLNDQFNQWLAVDETTGALGLMYYDTVGDPGRKKTDVWYQSSFDDGQTWSAPVKVTTGETDETAAGADSGNQYGDYNSLSGYAGIFFPSWTDRRNNAREEIWSARVLDPACTVPGTPSIAAATTPGDNQIQVSWTNGAPASSAFNVYRALGTCAAAGTYSKIAGPVASSPYLDSPVSGSLTYAYRVAGIDGTGACESPRSSCVEATATGPCTVAPGFAGLQSVTNSAASTCTLQLSWSQGTPLCAGSLSYNVYRDVTSSFTPGPANRISTGVTGTTYTDFDTLTDRTTYYYVVRAVDVSNGAEEGNTVRKSGVPTGPIVTGNVVETFEGSQSGGGFDNAGWSHAAVTGAIDWVWSTAQTQTPTHSWFSSSQTSVSDRVLVTPTFFVQANTSLSFWHTFAFEGTVAQCYDAGTLEISTDGGASWNVLPDAAFTAGGFSGTVNSGFSNPLAGKRAWCSGTVGYMTQVTASLGSFAGSEAKLRWHEGDDSSAKATGWYVDSVTIANAGVAGVCSSSSSSPTPPPATSPTPTFSATPTATTGPSLTPMPTSTETASPLATSTATATSMPTSTATSIPTSTSTATETPTVAASATATSTRTSTITRTSTRTGTPTRTRTATRTRTPTRTGTPTSTPGETRSPTPTETATDTPTSAPSHTATAEPTQTPTPPATATAEPISTPTATTPASFVALGQHAVSAGARIQASGELPAGAYCLCIVPNAAYAIGTDYSGTKLAFLSVTHGGGALAPVQLWESAAEGSYDLLALHGACTSAPARIAAGDDLSSGPGLVVMRILSSPSPLLLAAALLLLGGAVALWRRRRV
jgi:hypothetical protein